MTRALACSLLWLALTLPAAAQDTGDAPPIVEMPALVDYVEAPWPEGVAQDADVRVELLVELDEAGAVVYTEVLTSGGEAFDAAAQAAVEQMRFTPAKTTEGPVSVSLPFDYVFKAAPPPAADPPDAVDAPEAGPSDEDTPPPPTDADPAELPITEGPQIVDYVEAPYPPEAEADGLEGTVTLLVTLDERGAVTDVAVETPAGNGFDEAALAAVRQMTFSPAQTAAGPVGVVFAFDYAFTLEPEAPPEDAPAPINLEGRLRQMGTRQPIAGAAIRVDGTDLTTTTDADGRFALRGVPAGTRLLALRHPEHVELDQAVGVVEGEVTTADLWMRARSYRENEAVAYYETEKQEVTRRTLSIEEVKRVPGTFGDPVKVIQTLPGAARSPFGTGLLIIRGANPEDTAVYVDGVRIPIVYHLTGTTSVLSPDVVQSVDYLPGGYGVQYGRSMAGTVDVKTKDSFDEMKFVWGTDILDSQVWFEGPVGKKKKHQIAVGARRSYIDLFIPLFTRQLEFRVQPIYWDYQAKWIPQLGEKDDFSLFVFGFQDIIRVSTPDDVAQGTDQDTQGNLQTTYQSHRFIASWTHRFSDTVAMNLKPSLGIDLTDLGLGSEFGLQNWNLIGQLRADVDWRPHPAVQIIPGVDFIGGPYYFDFRSPLSFDDLGDPLAERTPVGFDGRGTAWSPTPHLKINLRPLADRDRWLITPGIRWNNVTYVVGGDITFGEEVAPTFIQSLDARLATRFDAYEEGDMRVTLKGATGTYHQPPQPFESIGIGTTARLQAERAWNSSLGIEHKVSQAVQWDLEGFYRQMDRLVEFNDGFGGFGTQPFANVGEGYAAGFELILRHQPVNKFFGWVSYTFSRSFRRSSPDADWVPFDFDQPHIFSAQGGYDLPYDIGISAQVQVVSGNPDTSLNAGIYDVDSDVYNGFRIGPSNGERLPTFVQTSFRVDKTWTFRTWQLDTYIDFINAIRGVNPETTVYNYDFSERAYVRGLPFIPNLGFEVRFWP